MLIRGPGILVVGDEPLIATDIVVTLEAVGARILGPVQSIEGAERLLGDSFTDPPCDMVVLDHTGLQACRRYERRTCPQACVGRYSRDPAYGEFQGGAVSFR